MMKEINIDNYTRRKFVDKDWSDLPNIRIYLIAFYNYDCYT